MLPGWQSPDSTAAYSTFFEWVGYAAVFLALVFQVLRGVYSAHEKTLRVNLAKRSLTLEQQQRIASELNLLAFIPQKVTVFVYSDNDEPIGQQIIDTLRNGAHWNVEAIFGTETARVVNGILVELNGSLADMDVARSLVSALNKEGVVANGPLQMDLLAIEGEARNTPIRITIGRRP
ncbi:MAG TPA: hypothetical protein VJ417_16555 [Candidatus Glassbacteria bacterium]|nr:hypothetical protein [Candidatus Glassbacteria bacterium]